MLKLFITSALLLPLAACMPYRSDEDNELKANRLKARSNFLFSGVSKSFADQLEVAAEVQRDKSARQWFGRKLGAHSEPCTVSVEVIPEIRRERSGNVTTTSKTDGGGTTVHTFRGRKVVKCNMNVTGPERNLVQWIVPHEAVHTVFAEAFKASAPRWFDEGAASLVETEERRAKMRRCGVESILTNAVPLRPMLENGPRYIRSNWGKVLRFYGQSTLLVEFLIAKGGHAKLIDFIRDYLSPSHDSYSVFPIMTNYYGYADYDSLKRAWVEWVMQRESITAQKRRQILSNRQCNR